ncbi:MAG: NAD(P)/FAD-dependent oxidoreductase [Bacteroidota bacterium]
MSKENVVIIGGGAAGFFTAANLAEEAPDKQILILEQSPNVLGKVKISGGGRCNVTHAVFEPRELVKSYPRGGKALMGPFTRFMTGDTMGWFEDRGVPLKIEGDGRVFPTSDQSQSIINCLRNSLNGKSVRIETKSQVVGIEQNGEGWNIQTKERQIEASQLVIATGGSKQMWKILAGLGLDLISPCPSLFTFNIKDTRLQGLQGISFPEVQIKVNGSSLSSKGPMLITHWGLSGPAILKLSAWGARELFDKNYDFGIRVNFLGKQKWGETESFLLEKRKAESGKFVYKQGMFGLPGRFWRSLLEAAQVGEEKRWGEMSNKQIEALIRQLIQAEFKVNGKSTFKDEFVTAGGVNLKEIDFKSMQAKRFPNLYFAGEVLNIDAVTGGFNFQAAWTTAWIVAQSLKN